MNVAVLPHDQTILHQIGHVVVRWLRPQLEQEPSNVRVEKTFADVVGIFVVVDVLMVATVFAGPHQN